MTRMTGRVIHPDPPESEEITGAGPLPYSIYVLHECAELIRTKGSDYQSEGSGIRQADHYPRGVDTIYDMAWQKMIRGRSILHKMREGKEPEFEDLEATLMDLINYCSFAVTYLRHEMDGQAPDRDVFNRIPESKGETK